jgi:uncharacterized membrane protein YkvA (DUF1232 family)
MSELAQFVHAGAAKITPQILRGLAKKLPLMKVNFAQIDAPKFPHLVPQLQFLANVVEDFADGKADELPYVAVASAAYALIYVQRQTDVIPDSVPGLGMADDSGVARVVLIENEKVLANYAEKLGQTWHSISTEP